MANYKNASILALGTANPPNIVYQTDFANEYFRLSGREHDLDLKAKMQVLCDKNLTRKRYLGHMFDDSHKGKSNVLAEEFSTIDARFRQESAEISKLGMAAANKAIKEWGQPKTRITHLIVHSTCGIKMPGVDFEIAKLLSLKPTVKRCMLYHYGCMSAATVLRMAKDIVENNDGARVLVVCSEVMLNFLHPPMETNLQTSTLFGDGAGALIVGAKPNIPAERPLFEMVFNSQMIIPNTEGFIVTELTEGGIVLNNSNLSAMGDAVSNSIESVVVEAVKPLGITDWNKLFWIAHPGAVKIVEGLEKKLKLNREKLSETRTVLREYGNMASATVFFVMEGMRKSSVAKGLATTGEGLEYGVLLGIGPGMTLETIVLRSFPISESNSGKVPSRL